MYSLALKILTDGQIACNVCILAKEEDGYIIEDIADAYKAINDEGENPIMEAYLEAICDGDVIQAATEVCKIYTEIGKEAMNEIVDYVRGLAVKYQKEAHCKLNYALLE